MDIIDETALPPLLDTFYASVRADPMLGPVFEGAVTDWPAHLSRLADFWSSVMLTSGRYKGNPVREHLRHADVIDVAMFERWLLLWRFVTSDQLSPLAATAMVEKAERIAQSLQLSLRLRNPEGRAALFTSSPAHPA